MTQNRIFKSSVFDDMTKISFSDEDFKSFSKDKKNDDALIRFGFFVRDASTSVFHHLQGNPSLNPNQYSII